VATPQHDHSGNAVADPHEQAAELARLQEELRLCRQELAQVRLENERVLEKQAQVRRGRRRANKEAGALAKALADVLYRELRERSEKGRRGRRRRGGGISAEEWQQVMLLHSSPDFRADWYLRQNLSVVRLAIEPALHFLRYGVVEGRNPGPDFDVRDYLEEHPDVRSTGENPVIHAMATHRPGPVTREPRSR